MRQRHTLTRTRLTVGGIALLIAFTLGGMAASGKFSLRLLSVPAAPAIPKPAPVNQRGAVQLVRFTLFQDGIYPQTIRVRPGLINLSLEDKTNSSTGLVVEKEVGAELVRQIHRSANHKRGREVLSLTTGRYTVYDASRPANKAKLVVEP